MLCHRLYRFHSIPTLRHNLDLWMTLQHFPQQFPRQLFVIHNQRFPLAIRRAHDLPPPLPETIGSPGTLHLQPSLPGALHAHTVPPASSARSSIPLHSSATTRLPDPRNFLPPRRSSLRFASPVRGSIPPPAIAQCHAPPHFPPTVAAAAEALRNPSSPRQSLPSPSTVPRIVPFRSHNIFPAAPTLL